MDDNKFNLPSIRGAASNLAVERRPTSRGVLSMHFGNKSQEYNNLK